jgi:predicted enzyme related to lactoylglutathione lyase
MSNPVVWFEVMGQDADKLRQFYSELLGWKIEVQPETGYGMVSPGPGGIAGGIGAAGPGSRGWTTFYTQVPCLETALETAQRLGSRVLMPVTKLPDTTIAVVSDPEGRAVGLCMAP